MNALESQLEYAFGDTLPAVGTTLEVAPGILWLRMGLPFALDHINLWLLEDEIETPTGRVRGWTAVDCGIATDATKESWESIFVTQLRGRPIIRVLVTHCHPDHIGLADWLCGRWNAPLWMSTGEYGFARLMSAGLPGADGTSAAPHFRRHGLVDEELITKLSGRNNYYKDLVPSVPLAYTRMQDQHTVRIGARDWRVITGFGHSPEHVSLYADEARLLISGDMVLPRISTNVSVFAIEPEANPVQQYLDSLKKYTGLSDDTLVLPSHGKPFRGLHTRITQLNDHHRARLAEVLEACATPKTAVEILPVMFKRPLDTHQLSFALGEAVAHLHKLWFDGVLQRRLGEDGIFRFTVAS
ncbi:MULTISPECIES: MBL fold metallo-hydrolase [unclassified Herbaspirillum]|uniref:MBL fold metallo-hydrolase n=1 Tax=unclassified Herbaspirillum TaxID=2624150 RepID=UPI000E2F343F|nr:MULTISPECIES: MBL fold metallo-hydrolase [unclassified Herbaspirillum]RFB68095.1 MBL fold metallo-hydrolase [Herbaspirillum sp. 3R-3a1]TFI06540.1 MBL fold metallo-hydrolase [Herbaspirillum sp. 3R11]TFI13848.1 MBL fold metallo-hydrolase [Herbaspirillum sp. 3R-11]TFI31079.1 MBL fold metallo-hydrolase [Herbaspirillum sp. 3C11]